MKYFKLVFLLVLLAGCKKQDVSPSSLKGKWELRQIIGGQIANAPSTFAAGNGNIVSFDDTRYQRISDGKTIITGTYSITKEAAEIDGISYQDKITFDNRNFEFFVKLSGRELTISTGTMALDGTTSTYQKL